MNPVFVIGHRNPDTDSICSAICYAHLKRRLTGGEYIACRAGHVNAETKFVLERFGVEPPRYIKSFEPRLSDVQYREVPGISEELSLYYANAFMYLCKEWLRKGCVMSAQEFCGYSLGLLMNGLKDYIGEKG